MNKKNKILICFLSLILFSLSLFIIFGKDGLRDISELKRKKNTLVQTNAKIASDNKYLTRIINRLKTDSAYIEHIARQELGMVKKEEIVLQFVDKKETSGNDN